MLAIFTFGFRLAIISCDALLRIGFHALVAMALTVGFSSVRNKIILCCIQDIRMLTLMTGKYLATG